MVNELFAKATPSGILRHNNIFYMANPATFMDKLLLYEERGCPNDTIIGGAHEDDDVEKDRKPYTVNSKRCFSLKHMIGHFQKW